MYSPVSKFAKRAKLWRKYAKVVDVTFCEKLSDAAVQRRQHVFIEIGQPEWCDEVNGCKMIQAVGGLRAEIKLLILASYAC